MALTSSTYDSRNFHHLVTCITQSGMQQATAAGKGPTLNRVAPCQCTQILNSSKMEKISFLTEASSESHSISCSSSRHVARPHSAFLCSWANPAQGTPLPRCTSAAPVTEHIPEKRDFGSRHRDKIIESQNCLDWKGS